MEFYHKNFTLENEYIFAIGGRSRIHLGSRGWAGRLVADWGRGGSTTGNDQTEAKRENENVLWSCSPLLSFHSLTFLAHRIRVFSYEDGIL